MTRRQIHQAREELGWLRSRYDSGAVSPAIYQAIRKLEDDISWSQHKERNHDYS